MTARDTDIPNAFVSPGVRSCPTGWVAFYDSCYFYEARLFNWTDALASCRARSAQADLVSLHDEYEQSFMNGLTFDLTSSATRVWIGLNARDKNDTWLWSDQWPVTFTSWGQGQPRPSAKAGQCVTTSYKRAKFFATPCQQMWPSVCRTSSRTRPSPTPQLSSNCPRGRNWHAYGSYCYYMQLKSSARLSWSDARTFCQERLKGDLAAVESEDMQNWLQRLRLQLPQKGDVTGELSNLWIGLQRQHATGSGFQWVDNTPLSYTHWAANNPDDTANSGKDCGLMYSDTGLWNDAYCRTKQGYVCRSLRSGQYSTSQMPSSEPGKEITTTQIFGTRPTIGRLGTQPTAKPNDIENFFSTRKNDSLVIIMLCTLIIVLLIGSVLFVLFKRRRQASQNADKAAMAMGLDNITYEPGHETLSSQQQPSILDVQQVAAFNFE